MNESIEAENFAIRVIELHGGRAAFLAHSQAQIDELNARWNQNSALMGKILRAHLFVEFYLTRYLEVRNENLGSLDEARLSFAQKVELVDGNDVRTSYLVPGLRRLNKIRNRLAHTLSANVSVEDRDAFLSVEMFCALRTALDAPALSSRDPVDVLESFAQHAGMAFHAAADSNAGFWIQAFDQASRRPGG